MTSTINNEASLFSFCTCFYQVVVTKFTYYSLVCVACFYQGSVRRPRKHKIVFCKCIEFRFWASHILIALTRIFLADASILKDACVLKEATKTIILLDESVSSNTKRSFIIAIYSKIYYSKALFLLYITFWVQFQFERSSQSRSMLQVANRTFFTLYVLCFFCYNDTERALYIYPHVR